jgi:hypothetical protein
VASDKKARKGRYAGEEEGVLAEKMLSTYVRL